MGIFGGGSAKRAAQVQADKLRQANEKLAKDQEKYGAYYDPYQQAGEAAIGSQQGVLDDVSGRISGLDPQIAALKSQQAGLQPQVDEMYTLAQQQDPILAQIQSGDMNAYQQTPGYEFRMQEGQKALEQSAAAKGQLFSGQTGKALTQYGQDFGTQEYDNYLSRLYNQMGAVNTQLGGRQTALGAGQGQVNAGINLLSQDYNQIAAQMGLSSEYQNLINNGLTAADAAARLGMNTAQSIAGNTAKQGDVYAAGMTAKANQLSSIGQGVASLAGAGLGAMVGQPMLGAQLGGNLAGGNQQVSSGGALPTNSSFNQFQMGSGLQGMNGPAQPWQNPDIQQSAALGRQSSYRG